MEHGRAHFLGRAQSGTFYRSIKWTFYRTFHRSIFEFVFCFLSSKVRKSPICVEHGRAHFLGRAQSGTFYRSFKWTFYRTFYRSIFEFVFCFLSSKVQKSPICVEHVRAHFLGRAQSGTFYRSI